MARIYNHHWSPPYVAVVRSEDGLVHVPLQACIRCGTSKNPLTDQLVRKTGREKAVECRLAEPRKQNHRVELARVRATLDAYEQDGLEVDREYGRKEREPVGLPLPYKD